MNPQQTKWSILLLSVLISGILCYCSGNAGNQEDNPVEVTDSSIPDEFLTPTGASDSSLNQDTQNSHLPPSRLCPLASELYAILSEMETQLTPLQEAMIPFEEQDFYYEKVDACRAKIQAFHLPEELTEKEQADWETLEIKLLSLEESIDAGLKETLENGIRSLYQWIETLHCPFYTSETNESE